jgi:diaminopimelate decarboxylase
MDTSHWDLDINHNDHLLFGGCDVVELAKTYGTPLHIVDENRLRGNYRRFLNAFTSAYPKVKNFYSYKTNCIPGLLKILHEEGCGAEVVSPYELWLASHLGVDPANIVYNGVNKSIEHLENAIQKNVGFINIDSMSEINRLKQVIKSAKKTVNVGIRIYPDVGWKAQFGLHPKYDRLITILKKLNEGGLLNGCGLHVHIGTCIRNTRYYKKAIKKTCSMIHQIKEKVNFNIEYVDLGGGFGVPTVKILNMAEIALYKIFNKSPQSPSVDNCPSIEEFGQEITACLKKNCAHYGLDEPSMLLEPGRIITSNAQILLLTVRDVKKRSNGIRYALTDGGMQNLAFPLSYEYHNCFLANRASAGLNGRYHIMGPLCSPEDFLYRNWKMPELKEDDILAIMDAGAYFTSFSNNFSYPRPGVVLFSGNAHKFIRQRESFEYLVALDKI